MSALSLPHGYTRPDHVEGAPLTQLTLFSHPLLEPSGENSSMGTSFFFFLWAKLTVFKVL